MENQEINADVKVRFKPWWLQFLVPFLLGAIATALIILSVGCQKAPTTPVAMETHTVRVNCSADFCTGFDVGWVGSSSSGGVTNTPCPGGSKDWQFKDLASGGPYNVSVTVHYVPSQYTDQVYWIDVRGFSGDATQYAPGQDDGHSVPWQFVAPNTTSLTRSYMVMTK